jgi:acyl-CoA reductase-like NAD-dependent aldehyde dehydrogenase
MPSDCSSPTVRLSPQSPEGPAGAPLAREVAREQAPQIQRSRIAFDWAGRQHDVSPHFPPDSRPDEPAPTLPGFVDRPNDRPDDRLGDSDRQGAALRGDGPRHSLLDSLTGLEGSVPGLAGLSDRRREADEARVSLRRAHAEMEAQVRETGRQSREALGVWRALPLSERVARMQALRRRLLDKADELASLIDNSQHKPWVEGVIAEIVPTVNVIDYWCANVDALLEPERIKLDRLLFRRKHARCVQVPRGVVGIISPWNYPVLIPLRAAVPALLCGNVVIHKPSENVPQCGAWLQAIFDEVLPKGVFSTIQGGVLAGETLITAGGVDSVFFSGSVGTGRKIGQMAAQQLIPCSLELGGKDAAIVLEDADIERTCAGLAWAAFNNAGQNRSSVERVFIVDSVYEKFADALVRYIRTIPASNVGCLTTRMHYQFVSEQIDDALHEGAMLVHGNERDEAQHRIGPTVLVDVPVHASLMTAETFGPVLPIVRVADEFEAVRLVNAGAYGLTTSIWTRDEKRGERLADACECGVVTINNHCFTAAIPQAPWSGTKHSGYGVSTSKYMLPYLVRPKVIAVDENDRPEFWWYPYNGAMEKMVRAILTGMRGGGFARFGALLTLLRMMGDRFLPEPGDTKPKK